jgi:hypothetical protein
MFTNSIGIPIFVFKKKKRNMFMNVKINCKLMNFGHEILEIVVFFGIGRRENREFIGGGGMGA